AGRLPGRGDPGADPQPVQGPAAGTRPHHHLHRTRPGHRPAPVRPDRGDAGGADRRVRGPDADLHRPAQRVHQGTHRRRTGAGPGTAAGETRAACRVAPVAAGGGRRPGGADPVSGGGTVSYDGHLAVSVRDRVATVELQRPEVLNALHSDTHRELQRVMAELDLDDGVGAVVLRGAGRAFCSGSDLREIGDLVGVDARRYVRLDFTTKNRIAGLSKPVVAAIHGWCVGGGVQLALACDIRVAAADAMFSMREVSLGSVPGSGGLQRLPAVVGVGVAKDWILTGRDVSAAEAQRRGLVTEVVAPDRLAERAHQLAAELAARNPTALHLAKVALDPRPEARSEEHT